MKVCHVTSMHDWKDDRIFERACVGLAKSGVEVHLIAAPNMNHYVSDLGQIENESSTVINNVIIHWLKVRYSWRRRLFSSISAARMAAKLNVNIVHFHDPDLLPWMYLFVRKKTKVIYDIHENYASRFFNNTSFPRWLANVLSKVYTIVEQFFINSFSGVIYVTRSLAMLHTHTNKNELIVGNLPYLSALEGLNIESSKYQEKTLVASGIISPARNALDSIKALALVAEEYDLHLLFAGKYPPRYKEQLQNVVYEMSLQNRVRIDGMLPYLENFKRISKAHAGCVFYEDNLNNRIGLPNRIFEYMFCELAVLGDNFPEVRNIIEDADCGIVVNSSNHEELSRAYVKLFEDPERLIRYGKNGRQAVIEKYNFEIALADMIEFYKKLLR